MREIDQKKQVERYFRSFLEKLPYRDVLDLFLMFIDSRPSCLLMNLEENELEEIKKFCRDYNFFYRIEEGESALSTTSMFITSDKEKMEILEKDNGRFCGFKDTKVGRFLDFPEDDAKYFSENIGDGQIEPEARKKSREMISNEELDQRDIKYLEVASYVPKPEEENIRECVETGSEYIKDIERFDEVNKVDIGEEILSKYMNNH